MIRHIAAVDGSRGIAKNGQIPWNLPADGKYFWDMTAKYGGRVLMGYRTFEAMKRPMAGRENYIATRRKDNYVHGASAVHDLDMFLNNFKEDLWIIGGSEIYTQTLQRADELYITEIDAEFSCDRFYPPYKEQFELSSQSPTYYENGLNYRFCVYARKSSS